jgi:hypothetical protein
MKQTPGSVATLVIRIRDSIYISLRPQARATDGADRAGGYPWPWMPASAPRNLFPYRRRRFGSPQSKGQGRLRGVMGSAIDFRLAKNTCGRPAKNLQKDLTVAEIVSIMLGNAGRAGSWKAEG